MDADDSQDALHHPLAGAVVSAFLDGAGGLIARLDPDGVVLRAGPRLARRLPPGDRVALADLLAGPGARRWQATLDTLDPGGPPLRIDLRFRGDGPTARHACLVHREPGGDIWLLALPCPDAGPRAPARELAREVALLRRRLDRSDRLARLVEKARLQARTDPLTGLANRRQGARWFRDAVVQHRPEAAPPCCIVVDIDDFKAINDTFGHPVGDRVLQVAARALSEQLRPLDRIFRFGGEEFVVLLPETDLDDGRTVADRLRVTLGRRRIRPLGGPLSASFGVACLRAGESAASLLKRADRALVRAKQLGRDRVEVDP